MPIISISNQKGGVGKTTTAWNLALAFAEFGKTSLVIDLDGQCNLTNVATPSHVQHTSYDLVFGDNPVPAGTGYPGVDIIPGSNMLSTIEKSQNMDHLIKSIASVSKKYLFTIIDTPPSLGPITIAAVAASDIVFIPASPDIFSFEGIVHFYETIRTIDEFGDTLKPCKILLTMYNERIVLHRAFDALMDKLSQEFGIQKFAAKIHPSVVIPESQANHENIFNRRPSESVIMSRPAFDYLNLAEEILRTYENDKHKPRARNYEKYVLRKMRKKS
jgi:chromosome partitioning protein